MKGMAMTGIAAGIAALGASLGAHASMLMIYSNPGNEGLGSFTGSMEWVYPVDGSDCGQLTVTLTNTSEVANGGFLTGFGFQAIEGIEVTYVATGDGWSQLTDFSAAPYGTVDLCTAASAVTPARSGPRAPDAMSAVTPASWSRRRTRMR